MRLQQPPNQISQKTTATSYPQHRTDQANEEVDPNNSQPKGWHSEEKHHRKKERFYWNWSLVFSLIAMGGAVGAAIFTGSSVNASWKAVRIASDAEVQANRAWIGTTEIEIDSTLVAGQPLPIRIKYENTGRGPALNLVGNVTYETFAEDDTQHLSPVFGGVNLSCDAILKEPGGTVGFPTTGDERWLAVDVPALDITNRVASGQDILVLQGCILYQTMGVDAATNYCFVLARNGKVASDTSTVSCQDGNEAE